GSGGSTVQTRPDPGRTARNRATPATTAVSTVAPIVTPRIDQPRRSRCCPADTLDNQATHAVHNTTRNAPIPATHRRPSHTQPPIPCRVMDNRRAYRPEQHHRCRPTADISLPRPANGPRAQGQHVPPRATRTGDVPPSATAPARTCCSTGRALQR